MSENKILVALDGSKRSLGTVQYLCSFKPFLKKEIVLHNIINKVPECYYDLKKEPSDYSANFRVKAWSLGYRAKMKAFMETSRTQLIAAGFKPEAIHTIIAERNRGIARDIMDEAQKGYDALLIRRRGGAEKLLSLAMGSISTKLVGKTTGLPLMLAGRQKVNHSLFLAIDGSDGAKKAVDFTAEIIEDSNCKVVLCSVLRDFDLYDEKNKKKKSAGFIRTAFEKIETIVRDAGSIFEHAGIPKKNIVFKIIQGSKSRSGAIVKAAMAENCDTIVFGRKGKSDASSFDIGRVPWKVIFGAKEMTVWIIP